MRMRSPSPIPLVLLASHVALPGFAQEVDCYREGVEAMRAERFEVAAEAFARMQRAPACAGTIDGLMYNEAVALHRLARAQADAVDDSPRCRALYAYRRALPVAREATRPLIEEGIAELAPTCPPAGGLRVVCDPPGATVRVPALGVDRGCPALYDDVRPRVYTGEAISGGAVEQFEVKVESGQVAEVLVTFPALPPGLKPAEPVAPVDEGVGLAPYGWIGAGLAAVSLGTAVWAYAQGAAAADEAAVISALPFDERTDRDDAAYADARERNAAYAPLYLGAVIGGILFGAASATLFALDGQGDDEAPPVSVSPTGAVVRF